MLKILIFAGLGTFVLLGCQANADRGLRENRICAEVNPEAQALCVREDLRALAKRRDLLKEFLRQKHPNRAESVISGVDSKSNSVYEYCVASVAEPIDCFHEKFQAEVDSLEYELNFGIFSQD